MKRFILTLTTIFICTIAYAHTINWHVSDTILETTTCDSGESITPPAASYKYGYHFVKWKSTYTPIEYLESTGTQYIDTGVAFNNTLKHYPFVLDFTIGVIKTLSQNSFPIFSGVCPNIMAATQFAYNGAKDRISIYALSNNNVFGSVFSEEFLFKPLHLRYEIDPNSSTYVMYNYNNDETTGTRPFPNNGILNTSNSYMYLFKCNGNSPYVSIRIYRWIYESNGIKIRDFIPVLDKNGTPCMYDRVEKKFYYNQGTGQFIAGPVISEQP